MQYCTTHPFLIDFKSEHDIMLFNESYDHDAQYQCTITSIENADNGKLPGILFTLSDCINNHKH